MIANINERFPNTPLGIRRAQDTAGPDGDWSAHVDWWSGAPQADSDLEFRQRIREAKRMDADIDPKLIAMAGIKQSAVDTRGVTHAETGTTIPYASTEGLLDVPSSVVISSDSLRANLPT